MNKYDGCLIEREVVISFEQKVRQQLTFSFLKSGINQPKTLTYAVEIFFEFVKHGKSSINANLVDFTKNTFKNSKLDLSFRQENRLKLVVDFLASGVKDIELLGYLATRFDHLIATGEDSFAQTPELLKLLPCLKELPCSESEWFRVN